MKYKAVIFDLDGTLIDTVKDIALSVNHALESLGQPSHSVESYLMRIGKGSRYMISCSLADDKQDLIDEILKVQMAYYADHMLDHARPYPGIVEMLDELKKRKYPLAVLSNKPEPFTCKMVDHYFGNGYFDYVMGGRDDIPLKPDPCGALLVAEKLGVSARKSAFVGDTAFDMQVANRAGMHAVGVTWGFRPREDLQDNGAHALIDTAEELLEIL